MYGILHSGDSLGKHKPSRRADGELAKVVQKETSLYSDLKKGNSTDVYRPVERGADLVEKDLTILAAQILKRSIPNLF